MASIALDSPITGHCNCGGITVDLNAGQGLVSSVCHCLNCRRAGGAYSVNYLLGESDPVIKDPNGYLKGYEDSNTDSGNQIKRNFCGNCGSPIFSASPVMFPGMIFLKGSLFDHMEQPSLEIFTRQRGLWQAPIRGAHGLEGGS